MEGLSADSEEKHEPASDIDTALMDSLKVLDPEGPIREADITHRQSDFRKVPLGDINSFAKNNLLGPKLRRSFLSQVSNSLIRLRATLAALRRIEKVSGPGEA